MSDRYRLSVWFFFGVAAIAAVVQPIPSMAEDTEFIGAGTGSGVILSCAEGRLSGIQIRRENSGARLITQIRGRCTAIGSDGGWANSAHTFTGWSVSDRPAFNHPTVSPRSANCGENRWVGGIRGETGQYFFATVMRRIRLSCVQADEYGLQSGSVQTRSAGFSGGTSAGPAQTCPVGQFAQALLVRRGYYVDGLALRCAALFDPTTSTPQPYFPDDMEVSGTGDWVVVTSMNSGAYRYEVCFADEGSSACETLYSPLVANSYRYSNLIQLPIEIPPAWASRVMRWKARACGADGTCSPWSVWRRTAIVPPAPVLISPAAAASLDARTVSFSWNTQSGATGGYQLYVYRKDAPSAHRPVLSDPTATPDPADMLNQTLFGQSTTQATLQLPVSLGADLRWAVTACVDFAQIGRKCSLGYVQRSLYINDAGASFSALLNQSMQTRGNVGALSYQNPRCITCHGMNANPSTKPNHPGTRNPDCGQCHQAGWHAPSAAFDFRNKSSAELCQMTLDHPDPITHLKTDALVLWSFTSDSPNTDSPASQNEDWNERIDTWVAGGMSCE